MNIEKNLGKKNPLSFQFKLNGKRFETPSISAYNFSKADLYLFEKRKDFVPLILDTNIKSSCSLGCSYCFTSKGKEDRFGVENYITRLSDSELREIATQFGNLGGKALFICSEGEPLQNPERFLRLAKTVKESGLELITYTNAIMIDKKLAKILHNFGVNLVLKLESLDPKINEEILNSEGQYEYIRFIGEKIPKQIKICIQEYGDDNNKIALSSIINGENSKGLLELRRWAFECLGISHFLKKPYLFGEANRNKDKIFSFNEKEVSFSIYEFDKSYGFSYPLNVSDTYSFDIRRFTNNYVNSRGLPIRVFGHPRAGVYHNSGAVKPTFGFKKGIFVSMRDKKGKINLEEYFSNIQRSIENYNNPKI